jgi:hypothetical protein
MSLNSCDDELHNAIRACPFDVHILHFVLELKPVRTRGYKVAFDMHFMKRGCFVHDKEKVDYLPEFDVDWQTARVELSTRVPIGIEKDKWTESLNSQNLLCVGQEELMTGVKAPDGSPITDPKWLDSIDKKADVEFPSGGGCNCVFRDFTLEARLQARAARMKPAQDKKLETIVEGKLEDKFPSQIVQFAPQSFSRFVCCPKKSDF